MADLGKHGFLGMCIKLDMSYILNTPSSQESGELAMLREINGFILKQNHSIDIKIGSDIFRNIYGINKVKGTPKADLALVTFNTSTSKFEEVCFLSHKKGKSIKDFGQWSGMTESAGTAISNNKLVKEFIAQVQKTVDQTFKNKKITNTLTIAKKIPTNSPLINLSMYGPNYGGPYGYNNVNYILQGDPSFTAVSTTVFILKMSGHIIKNGERPQDAMVLMAYRKGAAADRSQFGVNARFVIQAENSRPIHFMLNEAGKLVEK